MTFAVALWCVGGFVVGLILSWMVEGGRMKMYLRRLRQLEANMIMTSQTVKWFGPSWGAAICDPDHHVAWPGPDTQCAQCAKGFDQNSQGVRIPAMNADGSLMEYPLAWHLNCLLEHIGVKR